jgi:hypothetical protein
MAKPLHLGAVIAIATFRLSQSYAIGGLGPIHRSTSMLISSKFSSLKLETPVFAGAAGNHLQQGQRHAHSLRRNTFLRRYRGGGALQSDQLGPGVVGLRASSSSAATDTASRSVTTATESPLEGYQIPSKELVDLVDAKPSPALLLSPPISGICFFVPAWIFLWMCVCVCLYVFSWLCVCVYVCVCVGMWMWMRVYVCESVRVRVHACVYVFIYVYILYNIYIYIYIYIYIHLCAFVCLPIWVYCIFFCIIACVCMCMYVYAHMYVYVCSL